MKPDLLDHDAQLLLAGGRVLSYRIYGDAAGRPLYFFHGFPGCRLQAALVESQARRMGLALVAFDRPGFGGSDYAALAAVDDVVQDVAALADHLGHARFSTIGISCGAPYALACARLLPWRVESVGLMGGIGPMDQPALRVAQFRVLRVMFRLARLNPWLISPMLALDRMMFRSDPDKAVRVLSGMLTAPDQQLLKQDPRISTLFAASLAEAYRQGIRGAMQEARRIARHSAAALDGVAAPVHIYQGASDGNVPPAMARFMAERLANAHLHFRPEEGHLSIFVHHFADCAERVMNEHRTR